VEIAIAASKDLSANGKASAIPLTEMAEPSGRCRIITTDGSSATTARSTGS
jgi:hypothetical protein